MKISRNSKQISKKPSEVSANDSYAESKHHIQCAIDAIAKVALDQKDPKNVTAANAIADLGVVMLGLN